MSLSQLLASQETEQQPDQMNSRVRVFCVKPVPLRTLPGFRQGHKMPLRPDALAEQFIAEIGQPLVDRDLEQRFQQFRRAYALPRRQLKLEEAPGHGSIESPHFRYETGLLPHAESRELANWHRAAVPMRDWNELRAPRFNEVLGVDAWQLESELDRRIDLELLVEQIESVDGGLRVDYDRHLTWSRLTVDDAPGSLHVLPGKWTYSPDRPVSIHQLVDGFLAFNEHAPLGLRPEFSLG